MRINGRDYDYQSLSVHKLLEDFNLNSEKVVVELDGKILSREDYDQVLGPESELEIVQFVGGG